MSPARARTQTACSGVERTNHDVHRSSLCCPRCFINGAHIPQTQAYMCLCHGPQKTLTYTHSISVLAEAVVILSVGWFEFSTRSLLVVVVDAVSMRKDFDRVG